MVGWVLDQAECVESLLVFCANVGEEVAHVVEVYLWIAGGSISQINNRGLWVWVDGELSNSTLGPLPVSNALVVGVGSGEQIVKDVNCIVEVFIPISLDSIDLTLSQIEIEFKLSLDSLLVLV